MRIERRVSVGLTLGVWALVCACWGAGRAAGWERPAAADADAQRSALFGRSSSVPRPKRGPESRAIKAPEASALLAAYGVGQPSQTPPIVRVDDYGARGDGVSDDSAAIRRALDALPGGGTLVFTAGKVYFKRDLIEVRSPAVKLWGYGATIYSAVTDSELAQRGAARIAIHLAAPETALYGLSLLSNQRMRAIGHPNLAGIYLSSIDQEVIDARLEYCGIFVRMAQRFSIARNIVYRSNADGIHVTTGSSGGKVLGNVVRETGDDMIAVVNYGLGEPSVGDILIEGNDVAGQYWGRGISVVGGHDVIIRGNKVARTPFGAGILVHSEVSFRTANVRRVRVEDNHVREVQTWRPRWNPAQRSRKTGQAGIDVYGQGSQRVSEIDIRRNLVESTDRDGILVRGNACGVRIADNALAQIGGKAVHLQRPSEASCSIACSGNTLDGRPAAAEGCEGSGP
jgi:hypothetical protein